MFRRHGFTCFTRCFDGRGLDKHDRFYRRRGMRSESKNAKAISMKVSVPHNGEWVGDDSPTCDRERLHWREKQAATTNHV